MEEKFLCLTKRISGFGNSKVSEEMIIEVTSKDSKERGNSKVLEETMIEDSVEGTTIIITIILGKEKDIEEITQR